jgi:hypothetical protein
MPSLITIVKRKNLSAHDAKLLEEMTAKLKALSRKSTEVK